MSAPASILIAAAGTGGHVLPGLAVARELRSRGWAVAWIGTRTGREHEWVGAEGFAFEAVDFSSVRGKGLVRLLLGPWRTLRAAWACRAIARRHRAGLLFTTGGYIAVPAGLGARLAGARLAFLNADAAPQLSLRLLRPLVARVLCGFEGEASRLAGAAAAITGVPVRADICSLPEPAARPPQQGPLRLLVLGGSLGARALNEIVPQALALLPADQRPVVVHQCGAGHEEATRARYQALGVQAEVSPFLDDMARRYAGCDLALCRSGAVTTAELCAAGVASLLVPLLASTTDHQRGNALALERAGAALHLPQQGLTPELLARTLAGLERPTLLRMAVAARALGRRSATDAVVRELVTLHDGQAARE